MAITRIHINQHRCKANRKRPPAEHEPVITVKCGRHNTYASEVGIVCCGVVARVVYAPENPLPCGATCWVETEGQVIIIK